MRVASLTDGPSNMAATGHELGTLSLALRSGNAHAGARRQWLKPRPDRGRIRWTHHQRCIGSGPTEGRYRMSATMQQTLDDLSRESLQCVETPALLIDLDVMEANIRRWQAAADAAGVGFRPHSKTHKMPAVAERQLAAGAV